jgi:hypothetical protein
MADAQREIHRFNFLSDLSKVTFSISNAKMNRMCYERYDIRLNQIKDLTDELREFFIRENP